MIMYIAFSLWLSFLSASSYGFRSDFNLFHFFKRKETNSEVFTSSILRCPPTLLPSDRKKCSELVILFLCRMDEMMRGQRGWRELAVLGDKMNKLSGMIEGLIWSPRSSESNDRVDDWAFEEVGISMTI